MKDYSKDAMYDVVFESSDEGRKRRETQMDAIEAANALRLKEMVFVLTKVEVAAWRRMTGSDRAEVLERDGRPLTPEEYTTFLKDEVDELRDAIFLSERERGLKRIDRFMREFIRGRVMMQVTDDEHDAIQQYAKERAERAHRTPQTTPSTVHAQYCPNSPSDSHATVSPASTVQQCLDSPSDSSTVLKERVEPNLVTTEQQCLDAPSDPCVILGELVNVSGSPCMDEGENFISQIEHTTAESRNPGENGVQANITQDATTAVRVATRVAVAIDQRRQGTMTTDENKQFDRGRKKERLFVSQLGAAVPGLLCFRVFLLSVFSCSVCIFAQILIFPTQVINQFSD